MDILRTVPVALDELEAEGPVSAGDVPAMTAGLRRRATEGSSTTND